MTFLVGPIKCAPPMGSALGVQSTVLSMDPTLSNRPF